MAIRDNTISFSYIYIYIYSNFFPLESFAFRVLQRVVFHYQQTRVRPCSLINWSILHDYRAASSRQDYRLSRQTLALAGTGRFAAAVGRRRPDHGVVLHVFLRVMPPLLPAQLGLQLQLQLGKPTACELS
jgi:hypothetical protein